MGVQLRTPTQESKKRTPRPATVAKLFRLGWVPGRRRGSTRAETLLLGLLLLCCLLRLLSLLRFLSHSILIGFNGWKRDTRLARGGLGLATASIVIRTDSQATASRCHAVVIALSTAVMGFRAPFSRAMRSARPSRLTTHQRAQRNCVDPVQARWCDAAPRNLHHFKTTVPIAMPR